MRFKKCRRIIFMLLFSVLIIGMWIYFIHQKHSSIEIIPSADVAFTDAIYFYQKDDRWKDDALGDSAFHMGDSGCLTTCLTSAMQMQGVMEKGNTPKTVNQLFSEQQVYDKEGNLQWDVLEKVMQVTAMRKEADALAEGELDDLLAQNCYPIACVKMPVSGNMHFVLLIGSENGMYWCMDPMQKEEKAVPLSRYNNQIQSIRYIIKM